MVIKKAADRPDVGASRQPRRLEWGVGRGTGWRAVAGAIRYPATFIVSMPFTGDAVALSEGC